MKQNKTYPMTPFDLEITDDSLQMMKLFLPYLPSSHKKMFGMYIRFQELQRTLSILSRSPKSIRSQSFGPPSLFTILDEIRPYLSEQMAASLDQVSQMMQVMDLIGQMSSNSQSDPLDMVMNMMNPAEREMFESYSSMFSDIGDPKKGGDHEHERMDESPGHEESRSAQTGTDQESR